MRSQSVDRLGRALDLTGSHDLVLGPCFDGGYYLVGLRAVIPSLFRDIEWSSAAVLSSTLQRAKELGLAVALLDPWHDVDTPADVELLRERLTKQALADGPIPCRRTWDYLCAGGGVREPRRRRLMIIDHKHPHPCRAPHCLKTFQT
jgi:hypothetical protein